MEPAAPRSIFGAHLQVLRRASPPHHPIFPLKRWNYLQKTDAIQISFGKRWISLIPVVVYYI